MKKADYLFGSALSLSVIACIIFYRLALGKLEERFDMFNRDISILNGRIQTLESNRTVTIVVTNLTSTSLKPEDIDLTTRIYTNK